MAYSLQVLYPIGPETTFDYDYYLQRHMILVEQVMGPHASSIQATKGLASGPDNPPEFYAIATLIFDTTEKLEAAVAASGPVTADIPNYTNTKAHMLLGEVLVT
jgi:uncharacterized protein (TIGR02118 family)